jgi:hypothetical protein
MDLLAGLPSAPDDPPEFCILRGVRLGPRTLMHVQAILLAVFVTISCNSLNHLENICNCLALLPDASDYRHNAKHVPIPSGTPMQITVLDILAWPQTEVLPPDAPRSGRELQLVQVVQAYLINASENPGDCDVHLEIAATPDKNAPRVIIETPVDTEYCSNRQLIQSTLARHGFKMDTTHGGDLVQPLPITVLGLPFEDFEHGRGSPQVATLWEIHPALVTFL